MEELVPEEIEGEGAIPVLSEIPLYELPYLAQDSGDELIASLTGHTATDDYYNGIASVGGYLPSTTESEETRSVATVLSSSTDSGCQILEILQPTRSLESNTSSGTEPEYQWRSAPMPSPEDRTEDSVTTASVPKLDPGLDTDSALSLYLFEEDSIAQEREIGEAGSEFPQGIQFMVDIQMEIGTEIQVRTPGAEDGVQSRQELVSSRGHLQGTAMSPLLYSTSMQLLHQASEALLESGSSQAESDLSTSPSLPALHDIGQSTQQQHPNTNIYSDL